MGWWVAAIAGALLIVGIVVAVVLVALGGGTDNNEIPPVIDPNVTSSDTPKTSVTASTLHANTWFVVAKDGSIATSQTTPDDPTLRAVGSQRFEVTPTEEQVVEWVAAMQSSLVRWPDDPIADASLVLAYNVARNCEQTPTWALELLSAATEVPSGAAGELVIRIVAGGGTIELFDDEGDLVDTVDAIPSSAETELGVPVPNGIRWGGCLLGMDGKSANSRAECFVAWAREAKLCQPSS